MCREVGTGHKQKEKMRKRSLKLEVRGGNGINKRLGLIFGAALFSFYNVLSTSVKKAMAPHSSTLSWKIQWMKEPCRLQSMGSQRVGHK